MRDASEHAIDQLGGASTLRKEMLVHTHAVLPRTKALAELSFDHSADHAKNHLHVLATLRLFHIVARALKPVLATDKVQLELAGVIGDRGEAFQLLDQPFLQKPLETPPLNLHQIGEVSSGLGDLNRAAHSET